MMRDVPYKILRCIIKAGDDSGVGQRRTGQIDKWRAPNQTHVFMWMKKTPVGMAFNLEVTKASIKQFLVKRKIQIEITESLKIVSTKVHVIGCRLYLQQWKKGKFIAINIYINKNERMKIHELIFQFNMLGEKKNKVI